MAPSTKLRYTTTNNNNVKLNTNYPFHLLCKTSPTRSVSNSSTQTVIESKIGIIVRETSKDVVGSVLDETGLGKPSNVSVHGH